MLKPFVPGRLYAELLCSFPSLQQADVHADLSVKAKVLYFIIIRTVIIHCSLASQEDVLGRCI